MFKKGTTIGTWTLGRFLGNGAFSTVYSARREGDDQLYAIKLSRAPPSSARRSRSRRYREIKLAARLLSWEYTLYNNFVGGHDSICQLPKPIIHSQGQDKGYCFLVLEQLGSTLSEKKVTNPFEIGGQILDILHHIHSRGILFRDVKPENFMFGTKTGHGHGSIHRIHCIDFGAAIKYKLSTGKYIDKPLKGMEGTPAYASLRVHRLLPPSRRDDLESLGYLILYLFNRSLPWLQAENEAEVIDGKESLSIRSLLPEKEAKVLEKYMAEVESYEQMDPPNYKKLQKILTQGSRPSRLRPSPPRSRSSSQKLKVEVSPAKSLSYIFIMSIIGGFIGMMVYLYNWN